MARRFFWGMATLALLVGGVRPARAAFVVTFSQSGSSVVANGVGTMNFTDLTFTNFEYGANHVNASSGTVLLGSVPPVYSDIYTGKISGPASFGTGGNFLATSGSSTASSLAGAGLDVADQILYVPGGVFTTTTFTVSSTWANTTIGGLGLKAGTYVWTWGTANPDSFTLIIPAASVPEPASLILLGLGAASLLVHRSRKRAG